MDAPPVFGCGHAHVRAAVLDEPRSIAQGALVQYHRVLLDHLEVYDRKSWRSSGTTVCRRLMTTPGVRLSLSAIAQQWTRPRGSRRSCTVGAYFG